MSATQKRVSRGAAAQQLAENESLLGALQFLRDEAMAHFKASRNPTAAWAAKLEYDAMERFAAQLLLYIKSGADAVKAQTREMEDVKSVPSEVDDFVDYIAKASHARAEWDNAQAPHQQPEN